jgi:hypothetical protein
MTHRRGPQQSALPRNAHRWPWGSVIAIGALLIIDVGMSYVTFAPVQVLGLRATAANWSLGSALIGIPSIGTYLLVALTRTWRRGVILVCTAALHVCLYYVLDRQCDTGACMRLPLSLYFAAFWGLIGTLALPVAARRLARRASARECQPTCAKCGYDLRGLTIARCPECGEPFHPALLTTAPSSASPNEKASGPGRVEGDGR